MPAGQRSPARRAGGVRASPSVAISAKTSTGTSWRQKNSASTVQWRSFSDPVAQMATPSTITITTQLARMSASGEGRQPRLIRDAPASDGAPSGAGFRADARCGGNDMPLQL